MIRTESRKSRGVLDTRTECLERQLQSVKVDPNDLVSLFPEPLSKQRSKELLWANYGLKAKKKRTKSKCSSTLLDGSGMMSAKRTQKLQREQAALFWASAVAKEEAWLQEKDDLIRENQLIARRLDTTQQRIKFLEDELRTKAAKVRKSMANIDDKSNRLLYMHVMAAMNELKTKQVQWEKEKQALEDSFRKELNAMEAAFDQERRDIVLERDALVREKLAITKKLRFAEQTIADMEQHLETADHEVQDKKEILLRNLKDFEKKFAMIPIDLREVTRNQLIDRQDEVLLQLFQAKITVHHIAAGSEGFKDIGIPKLR